MGRTTQQASRSVTIPPKLKPWLELANSIPPHQDFPNLYNWLAHIQRGQNLNAEEELAAVFEAFPMQTYPVFRRHVGKVTFSRIMELIVSCNECESSRAYLRAIASAAERRQENESTPIPVWAFTRLQLPSWLVRTITWRIDETGRVRIETGELAQALDDVEASRIRICPLCEILYWAGRSDQPACSRKHAQALRTRAWRQRYPEYKQQRYQKSESKNTNLNNKSRKEARRKGNE
jgi:hypothetical protein